MTDHQYRAIRNIMLCGLTLFLLGLGYSTWIGYQGRSALRDAQVRACERGKLDRTDNARFQMAYARYNKLVLEAASVKADVKAAARNLRSTVLKTAPSLLSRTGNRLDCQAIAPDASLLPF